MHTSLTCSLALACLLSLVASCSTDAPPTTCDPKFLPGAATPDPSWPAKVIPDKYLHIGVPIDGCMDGFGLRWVAPDCAGNFVHFTKCDDSTSCNINLCDELPICIAGEDMMRVTVYFTPIAKQDPVALPAFGTPNTASWLFKAMLHCGQY